MPRELIWIEDLSRWGCSCCAWVFKPRRPLGEAAIEKMKHKFEIEWDREFILHRCSEYPKRNSSVT